MSTVFHRAAPRLWVKVNNSASKDSLILRNSKSRHDTLFCDFLKPIPYFTSFHEPSSFIFKADVTEVKKRQRRWEVQVSADVRHNSAKYHFITQSCQVLNTSCGVQTPPLILWAPGSESTPVFFWLLETPWCWLFIQQLHAYLYR